MRIRIRYFASLREALGPGEELELETSATIGAVRTALVQRGGAYAQVLGPSRAVRCAWNRLVVGEEATIDQDGELAFFPPVTGG